MFGVLGEFRQQRKSNQYAKRPLALLLPFLATTLGAPERSRDHRTE